MGGRNPQAHPFVVPVEWGEEIEGPAGNVLCGSDFFEIPVTEITARTRTSRETATLRFRLRSPVGVDVALAVLTSSMGIGVSISP